ncbi:MAG: hypothetical protein IKA79_05775, partial [Lentisphaeria bacterium]|nr:hypothetical protein [Lentisphaeria bacterium]
VRDLPKEKEEHLQKKKRHIVLEQAEKKQYKHHNGSHAYHQDMQEENFLPGLSAATSGQKGDVPTSGMRKRRVPPPFRNPLSSFFPSSLCLLFLTFSFSTLQAGPPVAGVPRDSNFNNTSGYGNTRIEAQLVVGVKENTQVLHFIRDNNDPRVVSKTYHIKNVDAYEFRDYLRQMVQAKRVGNTSLQQQYPTNTPATAQTPAAATVSSPAPVTPVNAQPTYNPAVQLGSNTAVECLKYADGTGLLIVSAEEYRFKDHKNGMGIDSIIKFLDKPQMGAFLGTQTFFYIPKYVPARNLLPLIQNVGMNISDVTEIWQGADAVTNDPDLNWLLFDVTNYSMYNIEKMLKEYDRPIPQVRLAITVYEIYDEDDEKMGLDFQAWKNNAGVNLFSGGGRFRDNWAASYGGNMMQTGSERTSFFNFNPKWSSRYIDFLTSTGKAKVVHTGEICIRNNTSAVLDRTTAIFYADSTRDLPGTQTDPDMNVNAYKMFSQLTGRILNNDIPIGKGKETTTQKSDSFGFSMKVNNASVNLMETHFDVQLTNSSLIGFTSSGVPRISPDNSISLKISLPNTKNTFVIGGLKKQNIVESSNGIPYLSKIPILGYLFSTKSKSVKNAELVVVGRCIADFPGNMPEADPVMWKKGKL